MKNIRSQFLESRTVFKIYAKLVSPTTPEVK